MKCSVLPEKLLGAFQSGWSIKLQRVPPSPDMAMSPLQPVLAILQRCLQQQGDGAGSLGSAPVELGFGEDSACPNAEQILDIIKVWLGLIGGNNELLLDPRYHCVCGTSVSPRLTVSIQSLRLNHPKKATFSVVLMLQHS
jgi:hypothetical protein